MARRKILFLIAEDWYFWSHRLELARRARDDGYEVVIATHVERLGERIRSEGFRLVPLALRRASYNPVREAWTLLQLVRIYRRERPDLAHHVALKPILYGSMAAMTVRGCRVVNAIAGLGHLSTSEKRRTARLRSAIWAMFRGLFRNRNTVVLVQNEDDRRTVEQAMRVRESRVRKIAGTGVDLEWYRPLPARGGIPIVMLPSRILWNKGIREFVEAASELKSRGIKARFVLVGRTDRGSPAAVPVAQLTQWAEEGHIEWWGHQEDMRDTLQQAAVVCLPSYREGFPRVLMEAAACGRPLVATDVPGCNSVVRDGVNGILVPPRSAEALVEAIETLLTRPVLREAMGASSRELAEREFGVERLAGETLELYREMLSAS